MLPAVSLRSASAASRFRFKYRDLRAVPEASVQRHWIEDLTGRTVRATQRYEPARIAASRLITPERRRECFEQTVKRQHRCFCCLALLTFTMDEEFRQRCCSGMGGGQERDRLPH